MFLTKDEEAMLKEEYGYGIEECMKILVSVGEAFEAEYLVPCTSAHLLPEEPLEWLGEIYKGFMETHIRARVFADANPPAGCRQTGESWNSSKKIYVK